MAVWSEVRLRELFGVARLDAEYYQPKFRENEAQLRALPNITTIGAIERTMVKGIFDIRAEEYCEEGVPFMRIGNLRHCLLETHNAVHISPARHASEQKTALRQYDLVLSKTAYPAASLVQIAECNCSQDTIALRTRRSPEFNVYLAVFLNTRFGLMQMSRLFQGNIQSHLSLNETRSIVVPEPDSTTLSEVNSRFEEMMRLRAESLALYTEAESLLLNALGLDLPDLAHEVAYERNFREVARAGRIDAQFYQPKYQRALDILRRGGETIGSLAPLAKRRFDPDQAATFEYIEIGGITTDGRAESEAVAGNEAPSRAQWIVQPGDVITSTVRPIRRLSALIEPAQAGHVCSSGFAVLEPKDIEPELLMLFLRLPLIAEILDLYTTATMYPAIAVGDLLGIPFTRPSEKDVEKIITKVRASRAARRKSVRLLDEAKARVEEMILAGPAAHTGPIPSATRSRSRLRK